MKTSLEQQLEKIEQLQAFEESKPYSSDRTNAINSLWQKKQNIVNQIYQMKQSLVSQKEKI